MTPKQAADEARANPAFWAALATGRPLSPFHRGMMAHLLGHDDCYCELPRGHGKTTMACLLLAWMLGNDPALRVKIVGSTDPEAVKTSVTLRNIVGSQMFRAVFPGVSIEDDQREKGAWRLIHGKTLQRDSSVEAKGVFGRAGGRFDFLLVDDVSDLRNAVINPGEREKVKEALHTNWYPMADYGAQKPLPPRIAKLGTPYHIDDVTAGWRAEHGANGTLFRKPCTTDGGRLVSPWPEAWSHDLLDKQRKRMGPVGYARAYELVPLSSALLVFQPSWLLTRLWTEVPKVARYIGTVDWGYGKKESSKADPDWSVFKVTAITATGHAYATHLHRVREPIPVFKRSVAEIAASLGVTCIYAEGNGPQDGMVQELREACRCPVVGLQRSTDKHIRATEVQSFVEQGRYHLPAGPDGQVRADFLPLFEEMVGFPAAAHDDCLDVAVDACKQAMLGGGQQGHGVVAMSATRPGIFAPPPSSGLRPLTFGG